jgi:MarR family 2-MHQ and catechol resistance regulon transcriptional repressor
MGTNYRGNETEIRALNAWIKMQRASNFLQSWISKPLDKSGVTLTQFGTLEMLYHLGPLCQKTIGEKLLCSPGNISLVINNLEKNGLVERTKDERDRRFYKIRLTNHGTRTIKELLISHVKRIVDAFSVLSSEEQELFSKLCFRLGTQPLLTQKEDTQ